MSSNPTKRRCIRTIFTANGSCGCDKPKLSDIFQPKPKSKVLNHQNPNPTISLSSSSSDHTSTTTTTTTTTTFSLHNIDTSSSPPCSSSEPQKNLPPPPPLTPPHYCSRMVSPCSKISDSVAVLKDSDDPYLDFRHSMLQMISEREIYSKDDLEQLLNCFLQLNSPTQHEIIVRAFTEIWNEVVEDPTREGEGSHEN